MARRVPCSGCGALTTVKGGTCRTCKPQARRTAGKPCDGCGTWTTAVKGTCGQCQRGQRELPVTKRGALKPDQGSWVTGPDLIARWVRTPPKKKKAA